MINIIFISTLALLAGCSLFQKDEKLKFEVDNPKQDLDIKIDVPPLTEKLTLLDNVNKYRRFT